MFSDYLYVSVTNSSAFSPSDTMPLSGRAKLLMAVESVSASVLSVLVVAFGVGLHKHWPGRHGPPLHSRVNRSQRDQR